ncbi:MAG TPA: IS110 family transposase [Bacteroidales bacterium]|nr:IS110 family transposase [Bacteroidales bacterium]
MIEQKNVVGIDLSKDDFQVQFITGNQERSVIKGTRKFTNDYNGFVLFLEWTQAKSKGTAVHFVMESTGVYYENLAYFLHENQCLVSVVLASKIKYFAKSLNVKTKTDKVDARLIALFGMQHTPQAWKPISKELKRLRTLCREIISCNKEVTRLKNQLHALKRAKYTQESILALK